MDDSNVIHIGIDPGVKTGCATWDGKNLVVETSTFWDVFDKVFHMHYSNDSKVKVFIEDTTTMLVFRSAANKRAQSRLGRNVGQVDARTTLMIEGFEREGIEVHRIRPQGKSVSSLINFTKLTGYSKRTSQHGRDAAMLVYGRK